MLHTWGNAWGEKMEKFERVGEMGCYGCSVWSGGFLELVD